MRLTVILSSPLGLPALHELLAQGVVAGVAVPVTGLAEPEELAAQVTGLLSGSRIGLVRLARPGLAAALHQWLAATQPAAVLVMTFPWRIPASVLNVPPHGFLNFHYAALPGYRGPEPIFWQIRNGETAGAVTVHRMETDFDTGPVLLAQPVAIGPHDTHGLHRAQVALTAVAVASRLVAALRGDGPPPEPVAQAPGARYWPRAGLADVCVRWDEPAPEIDRLVRAVNPWNRGALTLLRGQLLRLLCVQPLPNAGRALPGTLVQTGAPDGLPVVACGAGTALRLDAVALDEGYFTGAQLARLGLQPGEQLTELAPAAALSTV